MTDLIALHGVSKSFSHVTVLDNIDFTLPPSSITGLLGPSGSGKSTHIKTALGMEKADSGTVSVLDTAMPNRKILGKIGYMAQSDALYEYLTGKENLEIFGKMIGLHKNELKNAIAHAAQVVNLTDKLTIQVKNYSGGMKRRLSLGITLLSNPDLMILDEPTVGIDPHLRRQIWAELTTLRDNGAGLLVTTHVMDEAELCDRIALLLNGHIIACDTPANLKARYNVSTLEDVFLAVDDNTIDDNTAEKN